MAASNTPSPGRKGDKIVRDALLAALRQDPDKLKRAAEAAWLRAVTDNTTFKEIADRLDGKAVQPIGGDAGNPLEIIQRITRTVVDPKAGISEYLNFVASVAKDQPNPEAANHALIKMAKDMGYSNIETCREDHGSHWHYKIARADDNA